MVQTKHLYDSQHFPVEADQQLADYMRWQVTRLRRNLKRLGANHYDLWLPEVRRLACFIQPDERLLGIVFGRYTEKNPQGQSMLSRGALIATDQRVLLLNKKPLFERCDEISYLVISGVSYTHVGPVGNVVLHTRIGDVNVRTFNQRCARGFVQAIEASIYHNDNRREVKAFTGLTPATAHAGP